MEKDFSLKKITKNQIKIIADIRNSQLNILRNRSAVKYSKQFSYFSRYVWTEYNCEITCPNNKDHNIEFIKLVDNVKANGNILKITKIELHNSDITETEFEFVKI